jgi:hypothetical protein
MLHRRLLMILAGALVIAVSPLAVRPVRGQGAGGYYYETYRYGYNPGYYARQYVIVHDSGRSEGMGCWAKWAWTAAVT